MVWDERDVFDCPVWVVFCSVIYEMFGCEVFWDDFGEDGRGYAGEFSVCKPEELSV